MPKVKSEKKVDKSSKKNVVAGLAVRCSRATAAIERIAKKCAGWDGSNQHVTAMRAQVAHAREALLTTASLAQQLADAGYAPAKKGGDKVAIATGVRVELKAKRAKLYEPVLQPGDANQLVASVVTGKMVYVNIGTTGRALGFLPKSYLTAVAA